MSDRPIIIFSVSVRRRDGGRLPSVRKWTDDVRADHLREANAEFAHGLDGGGIRAIASLISGHVQPLEVDMTANYGAGRITFVDDEDDCVLLDNYDAYREAARVLVSSAPHYSLEFVHDMTGSPVKRTVRSCSPKATAVGAPPAKQSSSEPPVAPVDDEQVRSERDTYKRTAAALEQLLHGDGDDESVLTVERARHIADNPDKVAEAFNRRVKQEVESQMTKMESEKLVKSVSSSADSYQSFDMAASLASFKQQVKEELREELINEIGSHAVPTVQSADDGDTIVSSVTLASSVTSAQRAADNKAKGQQYPTWCEFYGVCQRCNESIASPVHVVVEDGVTATHVCAACCEGWARAAQLPVVTLRQCDGPTARRTAKTVAAVLRTYANVCHVSEELAAKQEKRTEELAVKEDDAEQDAAAVASPPDGETMQEVQVAVSESHEHTKRCERTADSRSSRSDDFELVDEPDDADETRTRTGDDYDFASSVGVDAASAIESIARTAAGPKSEVSGTPPASNEREVEVEQKEQADESKEETPPGNTLDEKVKAALSNKDCINDELSELRGTFRRGVNNFVDAVSEAVQEHTNNKTGNIFRRADSAPRSRSPSDAESKSSQTFASSLDAEEKWRQPKAWVPAATQTDETVPYTPDAVWSPPPPVVHVSTGTSDGGTSADALCSLRLMGFGDASLNARLLHAHKGDLDAVVAALCGDDVPVAIPGVW